MQVLSKRGIPKFIAASCIISFIYILFGLFVFLIIPSAKNLLIFIIDNIPFHKEQFIEFAQPIIEHISKYSQEVSKFKESIGQSFINIISLATQALLKLLENGIAIANFFITLAISPVIGFHALKDWDLFVARFRHIIPIWARDHAAALFTGIDDSLAKYIRGQTMVCAILAAFYALSLFAIRLRFGFVLGALTGLFAFIPYVTFSASIAIAILVAFLQHGSIIFVCSIIGIYIIGNLLESAILSSYFIEDAVGIHSIVMLFAVLAGGMLKGFTGVFLAIPIATILAALWRFSRGYYFQSLVYLGSKNSP